MGRVVILLMFLFLSQHAKAIVQPDISLEVFSSGYSDPLAVRNDGVNNWLYIVQRNGEIVISDSLGNKATVPFLDIKDRVLSGGERGLLGLAFHPQFKTNRVFVVNYTRKNDGATVISTFKAFENNLMEANPKSEKIILTIPQPSANHNGGDIHFAKDGYLYIGMGDGGGGGDPKNYAQNLQSLLGKMLRIHLDSDSTYIIPDGNPFKNDRSKLGEIWSYGLRNPWRFSFDRLNDDLWIADVGQNAFEEVNHAPSPRMGGENYGWRCFEGDQVFNNTDCNETYDFPIFTYNRTTATGGRSITGGFVYRGSEFPDLYGYYVCADYLSGNFWLLKQDNSNLEVILKNKVVSNITSFGEDLDGELYASSFNGNIYKVGSLCSDLKIDSTKIQSISCPSKTDGSIEIFLTNPSEQYKVLWSNGDSNLIISDLEQGWYQLQLTDSKGCVLTDSFEVSFSKALPEIVMEVDSLLTNAIGSYQWFENGNPIDSAHEFFIIPQQSGIYQVEVTDLEDCKLLSEVFELNINALKDNKSMETFHIFPNPTNDFITIKTSQNFNSKFGTVRVFDLNGRVVLEQTMKNIDSPISLKTLSKGIYFIQLSIEDAGYRGISKVVKIND
ncbi:MAG TPA: PQQ-dependent sugar dehydrogenase [Chitinophagales bacterium]|nr:PQQ-dependent sugar dehydrogenase [Chitinophagales bacterium]